NLLQNLVVGDYSVLVKNTVTGCVDSALFIVPDDSPAFTPEISAAATPLTFCTGFDGDAQVRVIVNPAYPLLPYNNATFKADLYSGAAPNLTGPPDVASNIPFFPTGSPNSFTYDESALNFGTYTFKVTDLNT